MLGDKIAILQYLADERAYLPAPLDTLILFEDAVTFR
jgi:hypothetical protein